jgi:predicted exporter
MRSSSKKLLLWSVFILFCAVFFVQQTFLQSKLPIETNILALLPKNQQDDVAQYAFEKIADNINNRVIFLIKGNDKNNLVKAAQYFTDALTSIGLFTKIDSQISKGKQQAWGSLYFPYRFQLLSENDQELLKTAPQTRVNHVVQQIYNPFSGVSGGELRSDPFLLFRDFLSTRNTSNGQFSLYNDYLISEVRGDVYLLIQADLAGDAFDSHLQSILPALHQIEIETEKRFHVKLLHTGSLFYTAYGTESAKSEISTIGVGSLIGILFLLLIVYRSALPLMLALLSIGCGLLVAFVATVLVFGEVHLFSLVFGASLIGVSIDYAFHYLTERLVHQEHWDPDFAIKQIFNAITLGLITSLIGYLGLLIAPFPGLQQLSLFSIVGLLSAYLTVVLCYPALASSASKTNQLNLQILDMWLTLWKHKLLRVGLPSFLILFAIIGLTQVRFDDDVRQLQAMPDELKEQEFVIKKITGVGNDQQLLLVKAYSEEALLQRLELLSLQFNAWQKNGLVGGVQSVSDFVPSVATQKTNFKLVASLYQEQAANLSHKLNLVDPVVFDQSFKPLLIDDYLASPVSGPLGFLWLGKVADQYASVIALSDVNNTELIDRFISTQNDVIRLDKAAEISIIFKHYRHFITEMVLATYFFITLLLIWRYGVSLAFSVITPPFIAGVVAIAITAILSIPITIFNLLALLLVLGIGIDYTLFFAEQKQKVESRNTFLAITLSAITTVLSFGLLALSETQAIRGFGVTVLTGIMIAWLLAPLAMNKRGSK